MSNLSSFASTIQSTYTMRMVVNFSVLLTNAEWSETDQGKTGLNNDSTNAVMNLGNQAGKDCL